MLDLEPEIERHGPRRLRASSTPFLGRGSHWPIAMERAPQPEISTSMPSCAAIFKHGPLALVDKGHAGDRRGPADELLEKLKSNLQGSPRPWWRALCLCRRRQRDPETEVHIPYMPEHYGLLSSPVLHVIPLQLLSYHAALVKGTDVDKPRNLAKSVTVSRAASARSDVALLSPGMGVCSCRGATESFPSLT